MYISQIKNPIFTIFFSIFLGYKQVGFAFSNGLAAPGFPLIPA
jgi:hypothetical protein